MSGHKLEIGRPTLSSSKPTRTQRATDKFAYARACSNARVARVRAKRKEHELVCFRVEPANETSTDRPRIIDLFADF